MNYRTVTIRSGMLMAALILIASCQGPLQNGARAETGTGTATVRLVFALPASRTIVPDLANAPVSSYSVTLTDTSSTYSTKTGSASLGGTCTISGVEISTWTASATAKDASGNVLGSGTTTLSGLTPGSTLFATLPIAFSSVATGALSFAIVFPSSKTDSGGTVHAIDYVQAVVNQYTVGSTTPTVLATITPTISSNGITSNATLAATGLPSGADLDLVMTFKSGGSTGPVLGVYTEAINIRDHQTSSLWIDPATNTLVAQRTFTQTDFYDSNAYLSQLLISPSATLAPSQANYTFNSTGLNYTIISVPTSQTSVYISPVQSLNGQYIEYSTDNVTYTALASSGSAPITLPSTPTISLWIRVTAPDHVTKQTYSLTFQRGYTITYNLGGGTNAGGNPAIYAVTTPTITLAAPTQTNYLFAGWYSDAGFTTAVTQIPIGSTGNLTFYAKWTGIGTINVTFQSNPVTPYTVSFSPTLVSVQQAASVILTCSDATLAASGTGWQWSIDGTPVSGATASSFTYTPASYLPIVGQHLIYLKVLYNGVWYSGNIIAAVTQ